MVGACQQNSGIFLVRGGGAGDPRWLAVGSKRDAGGVSRLDWQRARSEMPAGAGAGLAAGRDGSGTSRDRVGGNQINSKENAL